MTSPLLARRLRSHRLSAPAATLEAAARSLLAVQAQDFVGGRWALATRTRGAPSLSAVDALFDGGRLVRSWTMRGTLHIVSAADLRWILEATRARQERRAAPVLRREGVDGAVLVRAEQAARRALDDDGRMTRADLFAAWDAAGIPTAGQRGYHLLSALAVAGVLCLGPVQERPSRAAREQTVILVDDLRTDAAAPADPLVELIVGYIRGHGPASARDAAWWSGLPLTAVRAALADAGDRVTVWREGAEPLYVDAAAAPRATAYDDALALPPFDEYYLSYDDRSTTCAPQHLDRVGPSKNGMVRAVLIADGRVAGTWTPARGAAGIDLFDADSVSVADARAAVARFTAFRAG
ncbi:winged helix DNA-binding domain-containing protein [Microbacterium sp. ABRD28]|uniref:winged helix DNA-binding domain-containing protein n=1 Tax=Microbacterium sp. ABRD28 TaxID=2268461 RepID=UPI001F0B763D|nr:winged helix DNA-binding domain-containing protein [Microbacterium sp. ABRD28]